MVLESKALLAVVLVEVLLSVHSIRQRSYERRKRSIVRIGSFLAFALLLLLSVVEWHARWYAFSAWLLILALLGTKSLVHVKESTIEFRRKIAVKRCIALVFLSILTLAPALLFPQHDKLPVTGCHVVATSVYTYIDYNRVEIYSDKEEHRRLTVQFWYPENINDTFPVIVFSHGAFGIRSSNLSLFRELASNGYLVCSIDHTYQCLFSRDVYGRTTFLNREYMREVLNEDAHTKKKQSYAYYGKWMSIRTADIEFVLDHILTQADNPDSNTVYSLVSKKR